MGKDIPNEVDFFLSWCARTSLDSGLAIEASDGVGSADMPMGKLFAGFHDLLDSVADGRMTSEKVMTIFYDHYRAYQALLKGQAAPAIDKV